MTQDELKALAGIGDARAEVDQVEREEPDLAARYREHAVLRQDARVGEWDR